MEYLLSLIDGSGGLVRQLLFLILFQEPVLDESVGTGIGFCPALDTLVFVQGFLIAGEPFCNQDCHVFVAQLAVGLAVGLLLNRVSGGGKGGILASELHISCILFRTNDGGLTCEILRHNNLLLNEENLVTHGILHFLTSCGVAACRLSFGVVVITMLIIHTFSYSATCINMRKMHKKPATP